MKIAGIKGGPQKGEVKELTPEDKVRYAVQGAFADGGLAQTEHYPDYLVICNRDEVKVERMNHVPRGDLLKGKWQNNTYTAEGSATVRPLHKQSNTQREPRVVRFRLIAQDALDVNGLPDLEVTQFTVK